MDGGEEIGRTKGRGVAGFHRYCAVSDVWHQPLKVFGQGDIRQ